MLGGKETTQKFSVGEMRTLQWISGHIRWDRIRNESIRERIGVTPILEKMVEYWRRWFGHEWKRLRSTDKEAIVH